MSDVQAIISDIALKARRAAREVARLSTDTKNRVLLATAEKILGSRARLQGENERDLAAAEAKGLSSAFIDPGFVGL